MAQQTTIHERMQMFMHFKKLTASELAQQIGVQRSAVSHIASGRNKPSLDFIQKLVQAFPDVSLDWLIRGAGTPNKKTRTPESDTHVSDSATKKDTLVTTPPTAADTTEKTNPKESAPVRPTSKSTNVHHEDKRVVRIVLFYDDHTFETFDSPSSER